MRKKISLLTFLMMFCSLVFGQTPDWGDFNYNSFQTNMSVIAVVCVDGIEQANADLVIAPFCGNERRGLIQGPSDIISGRYYYSVGISGNSNDAITFKLYDCQNQTEYPITNNEIIYLQPNGRLGKYGNPYVINFNSVAKVGDVKFGSVIDAVNYAEAGQTVTLTNDSEITSTVVINKAITLDLNGKKVEQVADKNAVRVTSDNVIITDSSENGDGAILNELFYAVTVGRNDQSDRGSLTINGGKFEGQTTSVYVACGDLEIRGGEFSINEIDPQGYKYVINLLDNKDASALVYGGTFHNFNPQNNEAEGAGTNFCAEGYVAKNIGNNTYTVIADPSIGMVAKIGETYFETIESAVAAAQAGDEIDLLANVTIANPINVTFDLTIDGNGKTLTYTGSNRAITVESTANGADLTVKNLTVDCTSSHCPRGINYNTNGALTLEGVTVKGTNVTYALNLPGSSDGATVTINNSSLTANIALNVWGNNTKINATDSEFISVDNSDAEGYAAIAFNNDGNTNCAGSIVRIEGGKIIAKDENGEASIAVSNAANVDFKHSVNNTTEIVGSIEVPVVLVKYAGSEQFYSCYSLQEAINTAAGAANATVFLLTDINVSEIVKIEDKVVIDLNGKSVTSTAKKAFEVYANATIMNGTINGINRCVDTREAVELTLSDLTLNANEYTSAYGNPQPLTIGGSEDGTKVNMTNVNISAEDGYGIISFVKTELTATNANISGYSALYVKAGSNGSSFTFNNSTLSGSNADNDVEGNRFATIAIQENGVTVMVNGGKVIAEGNHYTALSIDWASNETETTYNNNVVTLDAELAGNIYNTNSAELNTVKVREAYASNLQAEGFITSEAENGLVTVTGTAAAKIGEKYYATFDAAYKAAKKGDTIELLRTAVITNFKTWINYSTKNITVKAEFGDVAFRVQDNAYVWFGGMTIESDDYCIIVGASDGSSGANVEIYGGTYNGETSAISVTKGSVKIMDGTFKVEPYQGSYEYTINCIDANYNNGTADVSIQGGKFYNFNPENNAAEGAGTNFLVNAYTAVQDAEGYWEVVEAVAKIGNVNYLSLVDAIAAANDGDEIKVLRNSAGAGAMIKKNLTIDFGGYTYTFNKPYDPTSPYGFYLLNMFYSKNVTFKNGTLTSTETLEGAQVATLVMNYVNLTLEDMNIVDATDHITYTLSLNSGEVNIIGKTSITSDAIAFDVYDYSKYFELPVVNVNTTGTIEGGIEVTATLNITKANLSENTYIVLDGNGQLFHNGITATIKKKISKSSGVQGATDNWNTISTPVVGGSEISEAEDGKHDLYWYDEANQYWRYVDGQGEEMKLISGQGYLYTNHKDVNFSFKGQLNTEAVEYPLSYTNGIALAGFNMIGNPFTHKISVENMVSEAVLADGFYTITKEGAWQARQGDETIAPLQSVLVKADKAATLTINPKANNTRKASNASLEIAVYNSEYKDVAYVSFGEGLGLDKIEHRNSDVPMVFVPVNGKEYAIATMSSDVKEIPVAFKAMTMGQYTLAVDAKDCEYSEMYLVDKLTGEITDLLNNEYTFLATSKDDANRFVIRFAEETETTTSTENFAYINNGEIIIDSIEGKGVVRIYDMLGRPISEYGVSESARISTSAFADGFYIIQMSDDNGVKVQKVVID